MRTLFLAAALATLMLAARAGTVLCAWQDQEQVSYTASAWNDSLLMQTDNASFLAGQLWQVDTNSSQGNVMLAIDSGGTDLVKASMAMPMFGPVPIATPTPTPAPTATPTPVYYSAGALTSAVLGNDTSGAVWDAIFWNETLDASTNITFWVRASDTIFNINDTTITWTSIGTSSPVMAGLPNGRYKQWRANLTTSDTSHTPVLHEVRLWYH